MIPPGTAAICLRIHVGKRKHTHAHTRLLAHTAREAGAQHLVVDSAAHLAEGVEGVVLLRRRLLGCSTKAQACCCTPHAKACMHTHRLMCSCVVGGGRMERRAPGMAGELDWVSWQHMPLPA